MSMRNQNEVARREELIQDQKDDYVVYYFWPSLSNGGNSLGDPPSSPLYLADYDSTSDSGPPVRLALSLIQNKLIYLSQSPITFAPTVVPVEMAVDLGGGATPPAVSDAGAQVREQNPVAKYSPIVKIGLFFSVPPCLLPAFLSSI
jgi:hypothetical protein